MIVLFLTEQGARLRKEGHAFVLEKDGKRVFVFPAHHVTQLVLFGRIELSSAMIHLLLKEGIDTTFLTRDGRFRGRLMGDASKNIPLRHAQFERARDSEFCLTFARKIIGAKAKNALRVLQKRETVPAEEFAFRINNFRKNLQRLKSIDQIRGLEGAFSALYFRLFPQLLVEDFGFKRRIKHPPPDPLNVLFSFGYTLLFQNLYALVTAVGLDPYCGFYHQTRYGHPALVSDLMEEFRAAVIDTLIIRLVNRRQIGLQHFEKEENRVRFTREGIECFVNAYHEKLETPLKYRQMKITYLQLMEYQAVALSRAILGEIDYQPFVYP